MKNSSQYKKYMNLSISKHRREGIHSFCAATLPPELARICTENHFSPTTPNMKFVAWILVFVLVRCLMLLLGFDFVSTFCFQQTTMSNPDTRYCPLVFWVHSKAIHHLFSIGLKFLPVMWWHEGKFFFLDSCKHSSYCFRVIININALYYVLCL